MTGNKWIFVGIVASSFAAFAIPYGWYLKGKEKGDVGSTESITLVPSAPTGGLKEVRDEPDVQIPTSSTRVAPTPKEERQVIVDAVDDINRLLRRFESAFKERNLLALQACFSTAEYATAYREYWEQPRSSPELRVKIIHFSGTPDDDRAIETEVVVELKEYGDWKSVGHKKLRFLKVRNDWRIASKDFFQ